MFPDFNSEISFSSPYLLKSFNQLILKTKLTNKQYGTNCPIRLIANPHKKMSC